MPILWTLKKTTYLQQNTDEPLWLSLLKACHGTSLSLVLVNALSNVATASGSKLVAFT